MLGSSLLTYTSRNGNDCENIILFTVIECFKTFFKSKYRCMDTAFLTISQSKTLNQTYRIGYKILQDATQFVRGKIKCVINVKSFYLSILSVFNVES